jgi:DNA-binding FadR family transcriptional regulator
MRPDWKHLQNETAAAQLSFLKTEIETGLTFARLALKASYAGKVSRNLLNARKAYETIVAYLADLPAQTPGLEDIREKLKTLHQMIQSLQKQT